MMYTTEDIILNVYVMYDDLEFQGQRHNKET